MARSKRRYIPTRYKPDKPCPKCGYIMDTTIEKAPGVFDKICSNPDCVKAQDMAIVWHHRYNRYVAMLYSVNAVVIEDGRIYRWKVLTNGEFRPFANGYEYDLGTAQKLCEDAMLERIALEKGTEHATSQAG